MDNIYALSIERAILSTLISAHEYKTSLDKLHSMELMEYMFYLPAHQKIFAILKGYYHIGKPYDTEILGNDIRKIPKDVDDSVFIEIISVSGLSESVYLEYAKIVKESYQKRKLIELTTEIKKQLIEDEKDAESVSIFIENTIRDFEFLNNKGYTKSLSEVRKERKEKKEKGRIKTGIPFIDTVFTDNKGEVGIRNEGLMYISGLKQSGKTFIISRILENVSKTHPVLFGSLEFGKDLYDEDVEEAQEAGNFEGNTDNIFVFDEIYDTDQVIAEIRYQVKVNGVKLVALDSMMRMTNNNNDFKTDEKRLSDMFSRLGKLSKELKVPIIIIVQSSKEDLKSSVISVKGSMNADHEAYTWVHLVKTFPKDSDSELRTVIWNKNKDTKKHPKQHLMFVPQTADFYRVELDENKKPIKALDKYRKPIGKNAIPSYEPEITTFVSDDVGASVSEVEPYQVEIGEIDF